MKRLGYGLLTLAALCGPPARAQQAALPPKKIEWFDADDHPLPSESGAAYRRETVWRDSVAGSERTYYPSGKLKSAAMFGHLRRRIRHGVQTTWYETGQLRTKSDYVAGQREGEFLVHYPDGTVRRRERYAKGERLQGECFGPDGQPVPFFEYRSRPVYSEGAGDEAAIVAAITRQVRYPAAALKGGLEARIIIGFTVGADGKASNVHVAKEPGPEQITPAMREGYAAVKASALAAAAKLKPFRPGLEDGAAVPVNYTVPITFRLQ